MMEYKGSYFRLLTWLVKKPMYRKYGKEKTKKWIRESNAVYRKMLEESDDIGSDNPMAGNTYMGYVFMAIWKAADGEIKVEDFMKVTQEMMDRPLVKIIKGGNDMNRKEDVEKMSKMLHAADAWQKAHPEYAEKSWDFHFDETKHKDGFYYYFTRCPMETYAREHGFMEVLPVCCDLDYCTAKLRHAKLIRDKTLADGCDMCEYWFVGDQVKDPQ